jgi:PBS lyase HEAT-like repeat
MLNKKIQIIAYLGGIFILLFLFIFFVASSWIGFGVKENCSKAQNQFEGSCIEALMQVVDADFTSYDDKNSAVWALGQLGDNQALPLLESKYQGSVPEGREKWNEVLSQHELSKAIKLLNGGWNISAAFWR